MFSIECVGLPGSGKSTLHAPMSASLRRHGDVIDGYELRWSTRAGRHPILLVFAAFELFKRLGADGFRLATCRPGRRLLKACLRQLIVIRRARILGAKYCVFQEGVTHEAWRLSFDDKLDLNGRLLHRVMQFVDLTILFDVSATVALGRIRAKDERGWINQVLADSELEGEHWKRAVEVYDQIGTLMEKLRGRVVVVNNNSRLEGDETVENTAERIVTAIIAALGQQEPLVPTA